MLKTGPIDVDTAQYVLAASFRTTRNDVKSDLNMEFPPIILTGFTGV